MVLGLFVLGVWIVGTKVQEFAEVRALNDISTAAGGDRD